MKKSTCNKRLILGLLFLLILNVSHVYAQFTYGTTGLINMPTADMQEDKTLLVGVNYLEKHTSPARWNYDTYNYYLNITFFPWLEVAYDCTLHKSIPKDPVYSTDFWVPSTYGKFVNQDRNFAVRIRLWKEGWWKCWTPQIVIGANDAIHNSWEKGSKFALTSQKTNGFKNRWYVALTKHFEWKHIGTIGTHVTYVYNKRKEYPVNGLAIGANLKFDKLDNQYIFFHGLNLMFEAYPSDGKGMYFVASDTGLDHFDRGLSIGKYDINVGVDYGIPIIKKGTNNILDLHVISELYGCKDLSAGLQFKIHL